ncbi:MAG TPA: MMPL family transporter, partial [Minicystis sp.]|nr:MMPL family transporter [Minicystis sp.]
MTRHRGVLRVVDAVAALYAAYVALVCRARVLAAAVIFFACVPATYLTVHYFQDIHAGLQELLPPHAPSVQALEKIHARLGGQSHLTVIAQSPHPEDNRRFITELTERLKAAHPKEARSIQGDVKAERAWVEAHAPLLVPRAKFDALMDDIEAAANKSAAEAGLGIDLDEGPKAEVLWKNLGDKLEKDFGGEDRFPRGYLETPDGQTVVMLVWISGSGDLDVGIAHALLATVEREVSAIRAKYPADMTVAYNGEVPNLVEEHAAILADLSLSSIIVFVLVSALIVFYFRSLRAVLVVLLGLGPGLLFTFALGRLSGGTLNSNTAFLGSIIAGNGINYPILLLAYYRRNPASMPMPEALSRAAGQALPGTLGAAATASAAYAGLAASTLRGFSQFGWLGAVGMLTAWAFTFLSLPIAVAWLDPPRLGERPSSAEAALNRLFARGRTME